jgi:ubiquinone/menaquinone biosynthesis C-methylase UbiE
LHRFFWSVYGKHIWDQDVPPIKRLVIKHVVSTLTDHKKSADELVLDVGCGTGHYAVPLAESGFLVTGVDYSRGMLEHASAKAHGRLANRLAFLKIDLNLPLPFEGEYFHHVICISSLWTVANPAYTLREIIRVLKPGGTIIIVQVPRHEISLRTVMSNRIKRLKNKSLVSISLVMAKILLERTRATKYWTAEQLLAIILTSKQFQIAYIDHGPPIIIVATKLLASAL